MTDSHALMRRVEALYLHIEYIMHQTSTYKIILLAMAVAFAVRLPLCFQPPETLIPKVASDDMFYYLCIARNIASGHGATADGEHLTNGFHPLWALALVPLFRLSDDEHAPVQWALVLLTLFSVLTAWFLYRILYRTCGGLPALFASLLWLCCPFPVLIALAGVEAPLYVLLLAMISHAYLRLKEMARAGVPPARRWFLLGIAAGVMTLARIDGAILSAIVFLELALGKRSRTVSPSPQRQPAWAFGVGCTIATLPWFVWSFARTGHLFQASGKAIHLQEHALFRQQHAGASLITYMSQWLARVMQNITAALGSIATLCGIRPTLFSILLVCCGIVILFTALCRRERFRQWRSTTGALGFLLIYGILTFLLYCAYLWYNQNWYYYSVVFIACVALGCLFSLLDDYCKRILTRASRLLLWGVVMTVAIVFCCARNAGWWQQGLRGWQADTYRTALWVKKYLPKETRLGSFNSGILAYYCPQTVVNLDGVVNNDAYRALKEGRIFSYMKDERIHYLVETPLSVRFRAAQSPDERLPELKPIHVEATYPEAIMRNNPVTVYEVGR